MESHRPNTALEPTPTAPSAVARSYGGTSEFMAGLSYTAIIEPAEPLASRRGSALDRWADCVMDKRRPKLPDKGMGKFCIVAGCAMVIIPIFASRLDLGERVCAAAAGFMGLSWGMSQVTSAKKWRQQYGEPTPQEQMEIKKSHSVSDLPLLLMWLVFGIAILALLGAVFVMLFHH